MRWGRSQISQLKDLKGAGAHWKTRETKTTNMDSERLYKAQYLVQPDDDNDSPQIKPRRFDLRRDRDRIARITHSRTPPQQPSAGDVLGVAEKQPTLEALEMDYVMIRKTLKDLEDRVALQEQEFLKKGASKPECQQQKVPESVVQKANANPTRRPSAPWWWLSSASTIVLGFLAIAVVTIQLLRIVVMYWDREESQLRRELGPGLYREGWFEYSTILF
ncbi:hypothetical protein TRICI_006029 [Trichomonascus ciferrii]|uniref:Uncharacterized protein n=1 Tax=Trichomonascus ciferrii TaxID=44093 RepID=A0A642URU1_9ASCO|nr:hypothetical protein TRICI_006029 [Trichomonascus ciferrii]